VRILHRQSSSRRLRTVPLLVAGILLAVGTTACTRDSAAPSRSGSAGAGAADSGALAEAAEQVSQQYLSAPDPQVIGSVRGTLHGSFEDGKLTTAPGVLEVLAVESSATSTMLKWRVSSDPELSLLDFVYYGDLDWVVKGSSQVVLESEEADLRLQAGHWYGTKPHSEHCTCALLPEDLTTSGGEELTSLFPALPGSVTEVRVRIPDFPALTVPVTRK